MGSQTDTSTPTPSTTPTESPSPGPSSPKDTSQSPSSSAPKSSTDVLANLKHPGLSPQDFLTTVSRQFKEDLAKRLGWSRATIANIGEAILTLGPELAELDVNPLWVCGSQIEALDALFVWQDQAT